MNYAHNRFQDEPVVAICEVCEEDCPMEMAVQNQREWGVAICDGCVEGGLECGALPLGGNGPRLLTNAEATLMFDAIDEARS